MPVPKLVQPDKETRFHVMFSHPSDFDHVNILGTDVKLYHSNSTQFQLYDNLRLRHLKKMPIPKKVPPDNNTKFLIMLSHPSNVNHVNFLSASVKLIDIRNFGKSLFHSQEYGLNLNSTITVEFGGYTPQNLKNVHSSNQAGTDFSVQVILLSWEEMPPLIKYIKITILRKH